MNRVLYGLEPPPAEQVQLLREKRFLLTIAEDGELESLVLELGRALGTHVQSSHFFRSVLRIACERRGTLVARAREIQGQLRRPKNGDLAGLIAFERALAELLVQSLREPGRDDRDVAGSGDSPASPARDPFARDSGAV